MFNINEIDDLPTPPRMIIMSGGTVGEAGVLLAGATPAHQTK